MTESVAVVLEGVVPLADVVVVEEDVAEGREYEEYGDVVMKEDAVPSSEDVLLEYDVDAAAVTVPCSFWAWARSFWAFF